MPGGAACTIELGSDALAEVIRLLPLVGLEPVLGSGVASLSAATGADAPPVALRVAFVGRCMATSAPAETQHTPIAPTTLTIALEV